MRDPLLDDASLVGALTGALGHACKVTARVVIQERWIEFPGQENLGRRFGRVVERVRLSDGGDVVVKMRNDRPSCRETLIRQHVLPRAGPLVPTYLGSCTATAGSC